jgi:hypothetical protein
MFAPCIVTDADPVPGLFSCLVMLILGASNVKILVTVPTWIPVVTDSFLVPLIPWFVNARTEVSDSQEVRSVADKPRRIINVYAACPKFAP